MASADRPPRAWLLFRAGSSRHRNLGVLAVWTAVERCTAVKSGVRDVRPNGLLRCSRRRHRGDPVELRDGSVVCAGDPIVELHLANDRLDELAGPVSPWRLIEMLREDLRALAAAVAAGELGEVAALHGETLLAAAGPRLGFELLERRHTWQARLHRFFFAGLIALHNRGGSRAVARKGRRWPGELWMSRGELVRRYANISSPFAGRRRLEPRSATSASPSPTNAISTSLTAR